LTSIPFRRLLPLLLCIALPLWAQDKPPPGLQPVPEPPPPPAGAEPDASLVPEITITKRGGDRVEEYRMNGKLYMMKVTPPNGKSYYLIARTGAGAMTRADVIEPGLSVPLWVIKRF
jgi:uncharacterized protein DUF2782